MPKIKDKETNEAFLKVIEILMENDPVPGSDQGSALSYLVDMVKEFEDKEYPITKTTKPEEWKLIGSNTRDMHGTGFVEAICAHGIGHHNGVHGCDGCCRDWPKEISDKVTTD